MKWLKIVLSLLALVTAPSVVLADTAGSGTTSGSCTGKMPNFVNDVCWSCMFPLKIFGSTTLKSAGQEDFSTGELPATCACGSPPMIGNTQSFWELNQFADVTDIPGCFPMLNGMSVDTGGSHSAFGYTSTNSHSGAGRATRTSFRQINLYINPVMNLIGAVVDDNCLDSRSFDVAWMSFIDPSHSDDELAGILAPYSFAFGNIAAIGAVSVDSIAAAIGFPIPELFWSAGSQGMMYPLTGTNTAHLSNEQSGRLQVYRVLSKQHATGAQFVSYGKDGMCGSYPQFIMDKRQYKFQRVGQGKPQTDKINGKCCDTLGRSTILSQSGTEPPSSASKDLTYAIFRKRDCCSGMLLNAVISH